MRERGPAEKPAGRGTARGARVRFDNDLYLQSHRKAPLRIHPSLVALGVFKDLKPLVGLKRLKTLNLQGVKIPSLEGLPPSVTKLQLGD
jgi:hypothetical protein